MAPPPDAPAYRRRKASASFSSVAAAPSAKAAASPASAASRSSAAPLSAAAAAAAAARLAACNGVVMPSEPPSITLRELRAAVPAHCFERSMITSLAYAARDVVGMLALAALALRIDAQAAPAACAAAGADAGGWCGAIAAPLMWCAYWYAAGCVATGWWMIVRRARSARDYEGAAA